jgi:hypothetical protein
MLLSIMIRAVNEYMDKNNGSIVCIMMLSN